MDKISLTPVSQDYQRANRKLAFAMIAKMKNVPPVYSERCIYRVPKRLRSINTEAYTPRVVSIGPFHLGDPNLKAMQEQKWRYLKIFLEQCSSEISMEECVQVAKDWENTARHCYAETVHLSKEEFVEMLILDATFIIEFLLLDFVPEWRDENDPIHNRPWMRNDVYRDIKLLENQLPFFVIEGLFNLAFGPSGGPLPSLLGLALHNFGCSEKRARSLEVNHFLDLLRFSYLPSIPREQLNHCQRTKFTPTATELNAAGVQFKVSKSSHLLDIEFAGGVLEIPELKLEDKTESLFRNLIAWEQCHYQHDSYIVDYMVFMDSLVNTWKDVELLVQSGIIDSWLGDNSEVAALFNNICKEVTIWSKQFYFSSLCDELFAHCRTR